MRRSTPGTGSFACGTIQMPEETPRAFAVIQSAVEALRI
jgi:hypothetical protein